MEYWCEQRNIYKASIMCTIINHIFDTIIPFNPVGTYVNEVADLTIFTNPARLAFIQAVRDGRLRVRKNRFVLLTA